MQDRAKSSITAYDKKLEGNAEDLARSLERVLRKNYYTRGQAEDILARNLQDWKDAGNRIPENMNRTVGLSSIPDAFKVYSEHLEKQSAIDEKFRDELKPLSATYILGLEKQIERLKADSDNGAIEPIEREIERTKEESEYFPKLMLEDE